MEIKISFNTNKNTISLEQFQYLIYTPYKHLHDPHFGFSTCTSIKGGG